MTEYQKHTIEAMRVGLNGNAGAFMVGGTFIAEYDKLKLHLRFKAKAKNKINLLTVEYDEASDTFIMYFKRINYKHVKLISTFDQVYIDQLKPIFEKETGLYLSI